MHGHRTIVAVHPRAFALAAMPTRTVTGVYVATWRVALTPAQDPSVSVCSTHPLQLSLNLSPILPSSRMHPSLPQSPTASLPDAHAGTIAGLLADADDDVRHKAVDTKTALDTMMIDADDDTATQFTANHLELGAIDSGMIPAPPPSSRTSRRGSYCCSPPHCDYCGPGPRPQATSNDEDYDDEVGIALGRG